MGTFYGGISHTPLSSLVLVCELAGSYDLLVPLMLAEGIAFVALRKRTLYHAQVPTQRDSPVHQVADVPDLLRSVQVGEVMRALARPERTQASGEGETAGDEDITVDPSGPTVAAAPPVSIRADHDLRAAAEALLANKLRRIAVVDAEGRLVGHLDEADISRWYLEATSKGEA
jgi:CIC family chloride channel protein